MGWKQTAELVLCFLTALAAGAGLMLHRKNAQGKPRRDMFVYYTNLSNLLAGLYCALLFVTGLFPGGFGGALRGPRVQLVLACCIFITHLVYAYILAPHMKKNQKAVFGDYGRKLSNRLVHYIAPLLAVAEWALCADKTGLRPWDGLWCLLLPLGYLAFAALWATKGRPIDGTDSRYPYFFIDADRLGRGQFWRNVALLGAAFALLGCLMSLAARWLQFA